MSHQNDLLIHRSSQIIMHIKRVMSFSEPNRVITGMALPKKPINIQVKVVADLTSCHHSGHLLNELLHEGVSTPGVGAEADVLSTHIDLFVKEAGPFLMGPSQLFSPTQIRA
jgi:hypothetical protein